MTKSALEILGELLDFSSDEKYEMEIAERIVFKYILEKLKPDLSLEIGSRMGGSLRIISNYSKHVDCVDIDPYVQTRTPDCKNIAFHIGSSNEVLPSLIEQYEREGRTPDFVHIDGDHSVDGAFSDIDQILSMGVTNPMLVLVHDSFNQSVRQALRSVEYNKYKNVKCIDIDFMTGVYHTRMLVRNQLWGGFALFYLTPEANEIKLISNYLQPQFEIIADYAKNN